MKKRLMGIDLGDVRTGLAVSDPLGILAGGIGTFKGGGKRVLANLIIEKAREYSVDEFVIGDPINMNGTVGERSLKVRDFAAYLEAESGLPVHLLDERCTTMAAHQIMNFTDTRGSRRKAAVDTLSAQIILQNYMDMHRNDKES